MKRRILSVVLALAIVMTTISMSWLPAYATLPATAAGNANDGVNLTQLVGNNIYMGKYQHATTLQSGSWGVVTAREASATPLLWKVMGEEVTGDGVAVTADEKLTLMSKYVLETQKYAAGKLPAASNLPLIIQQPASVGKAANTTAVFSVVVVLSTGHTFKWQVSADGGASFADATTGTGMTTATYTTAALTTADNGTQYRCIVTSAGGSVTSDAATANVGSSAPVVTLHPYSQAIVEGGSVSFAATRSTGNQYQWQVSTDGGANYSNVTIGTGATTLTYVIPYVSMADNNNRYRCQIFNTGVLIATTDAAVLRMVGKSDYPADSLYSHSNVREFINSNLNDTNAFSKGEYGSIPDTVVTQRYFNSNRLNNTERTERTGFTYGYFYPNSNIATTQKLYIPTAVDFTVNWPAAGWAAYEKVAWSASSSVVKDGSNYVTEIKNIVPDTDLLGKLKNGTAVTYWTSHFTGSGGPSMSVAYQSNSSFSSTNLQASIAAYGVRPIFKLDPSKIIMTEEITSAGNGYVVGTSPEKNFKLTLVQDATGTLGITGLAKSGLPLANNDTVFVAPGSSLSLSGQASLSTNTIRYKIVDSSRTIVASGVAAGQASTALSIPTTGLAGSYDLYLWEQLTNLDQSNIASNPIHLIMNVEDNVAVTGVTLSDTTLSIGLGSNATITANVSPANATNKSVTWSTNNGSVATVVGGVVTANSQGTATIKATTVDGSFEATCLVTVTVKNVTGVSLNKSSTSITKNMTETLIAVISPSDATNKTVTWSSDNTSIATVDSNGTVTAVASGTANIKVTTVDGSFVATCQVLVPTPATSVSLNKSTASISVGGATETLIATVLPSGATNKSVTWSTSNNGVATVSNGVVTAVAAGTATITVTTVDGSFTSTCVVTVLDPAIENVKALINALPVTTTLANKTQVQAARNAYTALTASQKAWINDELMNKLINAENGVYGIVMQEITDKVINPGFEDGKNNWGGSLPSVTTDPAHVHGGTSALEIPASSGGGVWQFVSLKPFTTYVLKAYVKTEILGDLISLIAIDFNGAGSRVETKLSSLTYTLISTEFTTGANPNAVNLTIWRYNYDGTGKAWVDDVKLFEMTEPDINFDQYTVTQNDVISNATVNTTKEQLMNNILVNNGTVTLKTAGDVEVINGAILKTGMKLVHTFNAVTTTYTVSVDGDVDGDGDIDISDLAATKAHLLRNSGSILSDTGAYYSAADYSNNGSVTISDLLAIKKRLL